MKRTITDNYIRHIIPINEEAGLIMTSYTDDIYAEMWERYNKISEKFLITMLHKEIERYLVLILLNQNLFQHIIGKMVFIYGNQVMIWMKNMIKC